jgi:hypothetical protein
MALKRLMVEVDDQLWRSLKWQAEAEGIFVRAALAKAIRQYVERGGSGAKASEGVESSGGIPGALQELKRLGLLTTGSSLKRRQGGGDGGVSGERGEQEKDAGVREAAGEAAGLGGTDQVGDGVRPPGAPGRQHDGELGGAGDAVPGRHAVPPVRPAAELARERVARQNWLRTHPEDESQDPSESF